MNDFDLELLINDAAAAVANPALPAGLAQRMTAQTFNAPPTLTFDVLNHKDPAQTRKTIWGAALLHAAVLALLFVQIRAMHERAIAPTTVESEVILDAPALQLPPAATLSHGGGGHTGVAPVTRGTPPPPAPQQIMPPDVPPVVDAKLPVMATVDTPQLQRLAAAPMVGITNANVETGSLGTGIGSGVGPGSGNGVGAGKDGGYGGGVHSVGGGVSAPEVIYAPEPQFSDEARKTKVSGNVLVYLQVDALGHPQHVRVLRGIGLGLDEKAVEAVRQYRFKPARLNGQPVTVEMDVEVTFNIY